MLERKTIISTILMSLAKRQNINHFSHRISILSMNGIILVIRATSHMRLRACDHYTSSTLLGGKGGAGPSSLHAMLEGPIE